jgi:hypothetical protein
MKVRCWCGCTLVTVDCETVKRGITESCGRRLCNALEFTNAMTAGGEPCDCRDR